MALPLFYSVQSFEPDYLTLDDDTSRHVVQVLRMKRGEEIELTDGMGNLVQATIEEEHKKKSTVRVTQRSFKPRSGHKISVGISLLKNTTRFEWFLEKATEVGVQEIVPLLCDRTEKQHFRSERMRTILVSAMLQSQQYWLPELKEPQPFSKVALEQSHDTLLIAHCEPEQRKQLFEIKSSSCRILIGPEGDFRPSEIRLALENGFESVILGETRLRSETAGVVAATILCICR